MAKFNIGDKVLNVNSNEKGVVVNVHMAIRGRQLYSVKYQNEEKDTLEQNIILDTDLTDPFECFKQGIFGSYLEFARINTTHKIHSTSTNTISTLKASKTIFKAYQFKPLLKFLNSTNRRLLIADEVGLGKTIEAGHIMMELSARKNFRNALVICPKMLQEKWKFELEDKFNFSFKIYDRKKDFVDDIARGSFKGIVNYEAIRSAEKDNKETNLILNALYEKNTKLDFVLCDEAHRLRNRNTQTYRGAEKVFQFAESIVFLTATPIMISEENLFNLLNLLDSQQFNNYSIFKNYLEINKPFIKAISQLNSNVSFSEILETLTGTSYHLTSNNDYGKSISANEYFSNNPLYKKIIKDLESGVDTVSKRIELQFDISSMSMMNNIFSRTRKREITTDWSQPVRDPLTVKVKLHKEERKEYDTIIDSYIDDHGYIDEYGDARMPQGYALGLIQKKRRVASSVYGYLNNSEDLDKGIDGYANRRDGKFEALLRLIKTVNKEKRKKIIVFALFRNTLKYLSIRLKRAGYKTAIIHGEIESRNEIIYQFKTENNLNILLSSEVGSEGLDMQFSNIIVNYDLPWNPMVVEQRIGRVDRFGQKASKVHIYNLIVEDSIQEEIHDRLLHRIGIFKNSIGDLEAIFDSKGKTGTLQGQIVKLEKELYSTELTREERKRKIDDISKAIITEKRNIESISEGLTDTLTNDIYFRNEIDRILKNRRYITDVELKNLVLSLRDNYLTQCSLIKKEDSIYALNLPLSNSSYLINFLTQYRPRDADSDTEKLFNRFVNLIRGETELNITFNQDVAYEKRDLIYVNAYHPIILATKEYFYRSYTDEKKTFSLGVNKSHIEDVSELNVGDYIMGVYLLEINKETFGTTVTNELLIPAVFNISSNEIITNTDICEKLLGESQENATKPPYNNEFKSDLIDLVRSELAARINDLSVEYFQDQKMRFDTNKDMQLNQTERYYENRITKQEQLVYEIEDRAKNSFDEKTKKDNLRILPLHQARLRNLIEEKEMAKKKITNSTILVKEPVLLSLNHISIF